MRLFLFKKVFLVILHEEEGREIGLKNLRLSARVGKVIQGCRSIADEERV
jgi:hypothetical protein